LKFVVFALRRAPQKHCFFTRFVELRFVTLGLWFFLSKNIVIIFIATMQRALHHSWCSCLLNHFNTQLLNTGVTMCPTQTQSTTEIGPTASVINALLASPSSTLCQLSMATGIHRRTINAVVYALEIQRRVLAADYSVARRDQLFTVIRAEKVAPSDDVPAYARVHPKVAMKKMARNCFDRQRQTSLHYLTHGIVSSSQHALH
jgi:hypothetical protein